MTPKYFQSIGQASSISLAALLVIALPTMARPSLQLSLDPPVDQVVPFQQPVTMILQAVDDGQPLPNAHMQIVLQTPPKTPWLTSDFPMVEGTTLLALSLPAPEGELQFQQLMPIRGQYQLQVTVSPQVAGAFEPFSDTLTVSIPENPVKYRNAAILAAMLLAVGAAGGWVIGGKQVVEPGEVASQQVQLLLSAAIVVAIATLLFINLKAERARAHSDHSADAFSTATSSERSGDVVASLSDDRIAIVGQTVPLTVQVVAAATGQPIRNAMLDIHAVSLEYGLPVLMFQGPTDANGELTWQQQFFDGAPHQVIAEVSPPSSSDSVFEPFQIAKTIDVTGIEPALSTRLISLAYLTVIAAIGMGCGFWVRRHFTA